MKHFSLLFLLIFFHTTLHGVDSYSTSKKSLKEIHSALFALFLPNDSSFNETEIAARNASYTTSWKEIKKNIKIQSLLQKLIPDEMNFPDDIRKMFPNIFKNGFVHASSQEQEEFLLALRRHQNNDIRFYATILRTLYIYMIYSDELCDELSGVTLTCRPPNSVNFHLPKTKLHIEDQTIVHNDGHIDYLIIGSGPAGCLVAHELARLKKNCTIVVVEAGSFVKPQSIITELSDELMESHNQRSNITGGIVFRNGWTVGGGTTVNIDLAFSPLLPNIQQTIQHWIDNNWVDKKLFHKSDTDDWHYLKETYQWITDTIKTREVHSSEVNINNKILLQADDYATTYSLNEKVPTGQTGEILKISAVNAFLLPALQGGDNFQSNVSLIPDAKVTQLLFTDHNNEVAHGAQLTMQTPLNKSYIEKDPNNFQKEAGTKLSIFAKNIIVCAGTLGSAEILLRSNLDNDNIGKGIIIHPSIGALGKFNYKINVLDGLSASVYAPAQNINDGYFYESMSALPRFIAALHPGSGKQIISTLRDFNYLGGFGIMLIDSVLEKNRIFINPETDTLEIDYQLGDDDINRLRKALKISLEMLFEQGAQEIFLPTSEPILSNELHYVALTNKSQISDAVQKWHCIENQNFVSSAHMQSSTKMGSCAKDSVVSHNFRVWNTKNNTEIPNLYCVDSSIFPTSIGANPMQSIYTFAKLFVDTLVTT